MYGGVNLSRHAKSDRASVGVKGTRCQGMQGTLVTMSRDIEYDRNTTPLSEEALVFSAIEKKKRRRKTNVIYAWSLKNHKKQRTFDSSARFLLATMMLIPI